MKRKQQLGHHDKSIDDPFELFVTSTDIRYCYYRDTHTILGRTFSMVVLSDFEALTPNLLCRTIETAEGGGIVIILLQTMDSLKQLYTMAMDAHSRFTSDGLQADIKPRFNERLILSLADCSACAVVDDELNLLPLSEHVVDLAPLNESDIVIAKEDIGKASEFCSEELKSVRESVKDMGTLSELVGTAATADQAKAVLKIASLIAEKRLQTSVALTAARGRGKSAALGLAAACAVANSYSNIFVTSPAVENVQTLFSFLRKGLIALGYQQHIDFEFHQSDHHETKGNIVRCSVSREHRQTVQYVSPNDNMTVASQAELLIIDEAAAIPLPLVRKLLGPYLVLISSTINGYEGTGRALSLKLLRDLRAPPAKQKMKKNTERNPMMATTFRDLVELELKEPIRYGPNDPVEKWLSQVLCLDATVPAKLNEKQCLALPSSCKLYLVNRDALFSYHKASERFLQRLMSLFVSSHYKNTPNDLLMLADAPLHLVFALVPPFEDDASYLPDVYAAVQVALEGSLAKETVRDALGRGLKPSGDLIPWTLSQHFLDEDFGALTGARIVRIANLLPRSREKRRRFPHFSRTPRRREPPPWRSTTWEPVLV
eukprot:Polyplicarium_translucidae@DN2678_c0_g1_i3.p1